MTTERQKRANQLNALKSTGPRTTEGKKRSSQNSRKHGLASAMAREDVDRWLRAILDVDELDFSVDTIDDRLFAALDLAEAEATLERAQLFEEFQNLVDFLGGPEPPPGETEWFERLHSDMEGGVEARRWTLDDWKVGMAVLRLMVSARKQREKEFARRTRVARRYRRAAESRRREALNRWVQMENSETNPNAR